MIMNHETLGEVEWAVKQDVNCCGNCCGTGAITVNTNKTERVGWTGSYFIFFLFYH